MVVSSQNYQANMTAYMPW